MKKIVFIAIVGILFLAGCNSQQKSKEVSPADSTEQVNGTEEEVLEEVEGAIDDSGELLADSTDVIESE